MSGHRQRRAAIIGATLGREFLSYRINRFLHVHLGLMLAIGLLALLAPSEAAAPGTAWWVFNSVAYVGSLSALLFGLSSAQAEVREFPLLFTQPLGAGEWIVGKTLGLGAVMAPSALLLVVPTLVASGPSPALLGAAGAAAGVALLLAWLGLGVGLWVREPVRGMIAALAAWCVLLFAVDLGLLVLGGAPWVHAHRGPWIAVLMLSPLDAYRVCLLFTLERAAFAGSELHPLTRWWLAHPVLWLIVCLALWSGASLALAVRAANRWRSQ
ncbi:MAG: hypothetical protein QM691_02160 [Opitutaceae bacterium]